MKVPSKVSEFELGFGDLIYVFIGLIAGMNTNDLLVLEAGRYLADFTGIVAYTIP